MIPSVIYEYASVRSGYFGLSLFRLASSVPAFLHYHDTLEIGLCLEGEGSLYLDDKILSYHAGDVQIILPGQAHYNVKGKNSSAYWRFMNIDQKKVGGPSVSVSPDFVERAMKRTLCGGVYTETVAPDIVDCIRHIFNDATRAASGDEKELDRLSLQIFYLFSLLGSAASEQVLSPFRSPEAQVILPAVRLVGHNTLHGLPVSVSEMASACSMSESHFRKIFTLIVGYSPKQYITHVVMQAVANRLLNSSENISEVMYHFGFTETSTFYRQFQSQYGLTPKEYRERYVTTGEK